MCKAIYDKMTALWLVMVLVCGLGLPIIPAWATGFTPVSQCFRNAGAPNWNMQLYNSGVVNTTGVPLTAASGVDAAGSGWLRLTDNNNRGDGWDGLRNADLFSSNCRAVMPHVDQVHRLIAHIQKGFTSMAAKQ